MGIHVCTMWENDCQLTGFFSGRWGLDDSLEILLTRIVVPLENGKGFVTGDSHDAFVVPAFSDLSRDEGVTDIMEVEVF